MDLHPAGPFDSDPTMIRQGAMVELGLENGERFHAQVASEQRANGTCRGVVASESPTAPSVRNGSLVVFDVEHVYAHEPQRSFAETERE